jgi:polar amino acid transport system substrate-binding protein
MKKMKYCLFFLALFQCSIGQAITIATEDYPPFNFIDLQSKKVVGISADKVSIMMQRAGLKYTIESFPWTRAYQMAEQAADTCVFSTVKNAEREKLFQWVGPLGTNNWTIYVRSTSKSTAQSLEDLRPYTIGVYRNSAIGTYLQQLGFNLDWANYDSENPRKLVYGRFDYWASGELMGQYHINHAGLRGQIVPIFKFNSAEMYLACNLGMPTATINKLNQILKEMDRDGTSNAIERKYRTAETARQ